MSGTEMEVTVELAAIPLAPEDQIDFWTAWRFAPLHTHTLAAIERLERDRGPMDLSDDMWLTLIGGDAMILKVQGQMRDRDDAAITEALTNLEARILLCRENRRRRYWREHGCTHELPAWATGEDRPAACPRCGVALDREVTA